VVIALFGGVCGSSIRQRTLRQPGTSNRFGLEPQVLDGLWGILTPPFLHDTTATSSPIPHAVLYRLVLLLSAVRVWLFVT